MPRMKSIFQMLLIALVLCGVIAGAGVYYIQQPTSATGETKTIFVEPGMALSKVASQLEEEELIRSVSWFKLMARYQKVENQIKVGRYRIDTGNSAKVAP